MSGRSKKYENGNITDIDPEEVSDQTENDETGGEETPADADSKNSVVSKLEQEIFDYRDRLVRKAAEFENYKKRTSEEFVRLINTASEDVILKLLPVLDDIDRFDKNYSANIKSEDLKKGVDLIFDKLTAVLKRSGLQQIECINTEFDPDFHDALLMTEKEGTEPNIVIGEHEKGYRLNDKVIRHAKVIVSK